MVDRVTDPVTGDFIQCNLYEVLYTSNLGQITSVTGVRLIGAVSDPTVEQALDIGALAFDRNGTLYAQDVGNGRWVDVSIVNAAAGLVVATEPGSLRPSVGAVFNPVTQLYEYHGAIAYDFTNDRFLAADNSTSSFILPNEGSSRESAVMTVFKGFTNDTDQAQSMANILIGGFLTGQVRLSGSVNMFYAGVILTGQTGGQIVGDPLLPANFSVAGDLRELITSGSIGTNNDALLNRPTYFTGFDLSVGGRVDQILTLDSFAGTLTVNNSVSTDIYTVNDFLQGEIEQRQVNPGADTPGSFFSRFGLFALDGRFNNDTLDTAQGLGTLRNGGGLPDVIHVTGNLVGSLAGDTADYYSMALLAGQTVTVQLLQTNFSTLTIYDPDGRLIASNTHGSGTVGADRNEPIVFQADRPGQYRIGVGWTLPGGTGSLFIGAYEVVVTNAGTMALGALVARNNILSVADTISSINVGNGDLGTLQAGNAQIYATGVSVTTTGDVTVSNGNLRTMEGVTLGLISGIRYTAYPYMAVPNGSIGLMRATGELLVFDTVTSSPVGKDIQFVDAAQQFGGRIAAKGGIGVIHAGTMTTLAFNSISVNADGIGSDGIIDLIDVAGAFGTLAYGGPVITTGPGGDVRYMRLGGPIFQDPYFQSGDYEALTLAVGQSYLQVDDSGGQVSIAPGQVANPAYVRGLIGPNNPRFIRTGALTLTQYAIRGSAGSVLVDVSSSDGGIEISGVNTGGHGAVEIGRIDALGAGRAVIFSTPPVGSTTLPVLQLDPAATRDINVSIVGPLPVDVLDVFGTNLTSVTNSTGGEIVNVTATTVGDLYARTVGLATNHTGAAVNPIAVVAGGNNFPFNQQHIGLVISGNLMTVRAAGALGNLIVGGAIGTVQANSDGRNTTGQFEGIAAPVFAGGEIALVRIGEGLAPSGTGDLAQAGIYADGIIRNVVNQSSGSDVYGNIISTASIGTVSLTNGGIIGSTIACFTSLAMSRSIASYAGIPVLTGSIGTITTNGVGGIIGTTIEAVASVGNISVIGNGFGIINTAVEVINSGKIGNVTADGFGIRNSTFQAATAMGSITATGTGGCSRPRPIPGRCVRAKRTCSIHVSYPTSIAPTTCTWPWGCPPRWWFQLTSKSEMSLR